MSACSRCNSPWPLPGCYVCGESLHEPENDMTYPTITTDELQDIADKLHEYAHQIEAMPYRTPTGKIVAKYKLAKP